MTELSKACRIAGVLQRSLDARISGLRVLIDVYEKVIVVRDTTRQAQQTWKYSSLGQAEAIADHIVTYWTRKREQHPESYATCACHKQQIAYETV